MSENSKDLRELLVELEYDELDPTAAADAQRQIDADPEMQRLQAAFQAVRADLQADEEVEVRPTRIAFVAMPGQHRRRSTWSPFVQGLAVAASFVFGLVLAAAFANMAGLLPGSGAPAAPVAGSIDPAGGGSVAATPVGQMSQDDLVRFLDERYARQGATQQVSLSDLDDQQLQGLFNDLVAERDQQLRQVMQQMIAVADDRQRQEVQTMMASVYDTFDAQRTNDLLVLADQLGILQETTGQELQRNANAIDYLFTRVGTGPQERQQ